LFGTTARARIGTFFRDRHGVTATLQKQIDDAKAACAILERPVDRQD
jgi:hypothetical protein